jgi:antitoxin MazE
MVAIIANLGWDERLEFRFPNRLEAVVSSLYLQGVAMRSKVQKWGNSLALRIPKAYALEVGFRRDSDVEVSVRQGSLVIAPAKVPTYALDDLLSKVTRRNRHGEVDLGPAAGREGW